MEAVNIFEAKTRLSQLVDQAAAGEDVIVSRNGRPVARITQLATPRPKVRFGVLAGKLRVTGTSTRRCRTRCSLGSKGGEALRLLTADAALAPYSELVLMA